MWAPPPAEPPWDAEVLHIEEQRRGAAPGVGLALATLDVLAPLLAVLAADRERKSAQTLLGDFLAAFKAVAVVALLEASDRVVDLVERLRLHLDEREFQIFLNIRLGALNRVEHLVQLPAPSAFLADAANLALDLRVKLPTPTVEHLLEFGVAGPGHFRLRRRFLNIFVCHHRFVCHLRRSFPTRRHDKIARPLCK